MLLAPSCVRAQAAASAKQLAAEQQVLRLARKFLLHVHPLRVVRFNVAGTCTNIQLFLRAVIHCALSWQRALLGSPLRKLRSRVVAAQHLGGADEERKVRVLVLHPSFANFLLSIVRCCDASPVPCSGALVRPVLLQRPDLTAIR